MSLEGEILERLRLLDQRVTALEGRGLMKRKASEYPGRWRATVNGEMISHVVEADEEQGYVIAHALHDGRPYLNAAHNAPVTYRLEGVVKIIPWARPI